MEKFYKKGLLTVILFLSMFVAVKAQALEDVVNNIRGANVPGIAHYFDNLVAITINNNQSVYSKAQAEIVLKDFFGKNPVKDFVVMQSGTSGTSSRYAIGKLTTNGGSYNLYVVLKQKENAYVLQEIRFEK